MDPLGPAVLYPIVAKSKRPGAENCGGCRAPRSSAPKPMPPIAGTSPNRTSGLNSYTVARRDVKRAAFGVRAWVTELPRRPELRRSRAPFATPRTHSRAHPTHWLRAQTAAATLRDNIPFGQPLTRKEAHGPPTIDATTVVRSPRALHPSVGHCSWRRRSCRYGSRPHARRSERCARRWCSRKRAASSRSKRHSRSRTCRNW